MLEQNQIYLGNCLELMRQINEKSVNLIIADLPYGSTEAEWDSIIPFKDLWEQN